MFARSLLGTIPAAPLGAGALLVMAAAMSPPMAAAQQSGGQGTCGVNVRLHAIGGEQTDEQEVRPINARECNGQTTLDFALMNLPNSNNLIVYAAAGRMCESRAEREMLREENSEQCQLLGSEEIVPTAREQIVSVRLDEALCPENGGETTVKFVFIPSDTDSNPADPTGSYGCAEFAIDAQPPIAPMGLNEPFGERTLTVRWDSLNDDSVEEYLAFFDNEATASVDGSVPTVDPDEDAGAVDAPTVANPDCPSAHVRSGATLDRDNPPPGVGYEAVTGRVATSVDIAASRLKRDIVPVAVAAVDRAGNVGPLSEVVCMEKGDTLGVWEEYRSRGGTAQDGCACSTLGRGHLEGSLPIGLVMLSLLARARRRHA
ncbi:MAG: hypothetical protein OXU20_13650 [Myxococcales bacterium]|nr:hypothetical protein [Myxococcales bacterium]